MQEEEEQKVETEISSSDGEGEEEVASLWCMPTIVNSVEKRRDYADEEQRNRIDWGDDE